MLATISSGLLAGVADHTTAPQTPDDHADWLLEHLGIQLPRRACRPEHTAPWDAFCEAYFARSPDGTAAPLVVWKGSRGFAGKSYTLAALGLTEAATLGAEVRVLGGSADQSENVVRYTDNWVSRPAMATYLSGGGQNREAGVTRSRIRLVGGGMMDALAASTRAVRGPHPSRLKVDEADELDVRILDAALGQTMARPGIPAQTVISSTHHYPDGTMTELLRRAKDRGWPVREWCWRCTLAGPDNPGGWLDQAEVDRKRKEVPAVMWDTEFDLQEPAPESRAFMTIAIEAMFNPSLGLFRGAPSEYIEIEAPVDGGRYSTGADWAKERDWTVIWTFRYDVRPARLVAYERIARRPWPSMVERFDERVRRFPGRAYYDGTGIGNVVRDLLTVNATPVILVGRARSDMLTAYMAGVEDGQTQAPRIDHCYGEHRFASVDDLFGSGHLPDSICAGALAWIGAAPKKIMTGRLTG